LPGSSVALRRTDRARPRATKSANFFELKWAYWLQELIPGAAKVVEIGGARLFFPGERSVELTAALRECWHCWAGLTAPDDWAG
jgi:hypothetical protein